MHFPVAFGPFACCFICSGVQLTWIFFFWLCFGTPLHSCKCVYSCWNSKRCHFETAIKVNVQVVWITKSSPVAAPFVCSCQPISLLSSTVCRQTIEIFSVSHSPAPQLSERINITFSVLPEKIQRPSSFFQWFKVMLSMSTIFALLHSKCYCNIWHGFVDINSV